MSLFDIDLRIVAAAVVLAPVGAFLIGPWAAIALRVAYIASMAPLLVFERRSRVLTRGPRSGPTHPSRLTSSRFPA